MQLRAKSGQQNALENGAFSRAWRPGCGDLRPSQIAIRGRGLTVLGGKSAADCSYSCPQKGIASSQGACAVAFLRPNGSGAQTPSARNARILQGKTLFVVLLMRARITQNLEPPANPGRFSPVRLRSQSATPSLRSSNWMRRLIVDCEMFKAFTACRASVLCDENGVDHASPKTFTIPPLALSPRRLRMRCGGARQRAHVRALTETRPSAKQCNHRDGSARRPGDQCQRL